jgi:hypothetical protein
MQYDDDLLPWQLERLPKRKLTKTDYRRRERTVEFLNELIAQFGRGVGDLVIEHGVTPAAFEAIRQQIILDLEFWELATGQRLSELRPEQHLALEASRWECCERRRQEIAAWAQAIPIWRWVPGRADGKRPDWWFYSIEGEESTAAVSPVSQLRDQFLAEHGGNYWLEAASLWALRKAIGRAGGRMAKLRFKDGTYKQCVTAWAAGEPSAIPITAELKQLYRGALVWEEYRWRWHVPSDLEDRIDELSGRPWRVWARVKLPLPGHVDDLFDFAYVRPWPAHYRTKYDAVPYRPPICYALDPELGDWKHRPDFEKSFVQRWRNIPELKNWDKAGWGFDAPEHHTSGIGEEPDDDESDLDARPERRRAFLITLRIEERGFQGYWQRDPGWAAKHSPAQVYEPLDYNLKKRLRSLDDVCKTIDKHLPRLVRKRLRSKGVLFLVHGNGYWHRPHYKPKAKPSQSPGAYTLRHVEAPALALSAKREECRRRREAAIDGLLSNAA